MGNLSYLAVCLSTTKISRELGFLIFPLTFMEGIAQKINNSYIYTMIKVL